ncbi:alpha-mannosidase [Streptomyces sp. FIT100]|uniref:alpha-mannosidase n=1 Tax=Streptomyces sp. FIT100 TaxID=2837956 RepID=UPI0021C826BC|nr:alpha-mannosidase [Streptomyces sp. FIT100]UUN25191.1 alpha-mannosidase [Streptomyces sp. FIT100]
MHTAPRNTLDRLERVLRQRLIPRIHTRLSDVSVCAWEVDGDGEPVPAAHALGLGLLPGRPAPAYKPFAVGEDWGPTWGTTWFRIDGTIPDNAVTAELAPSPVELVVDLGWADHSVGGQAEGLVHRPDGSVLKAVHPRCGWVRLTGPGAPESLVRPDGTFTVYVEAASNPLLLDVVPFIATRLGEKETAGSDPGYRLVRAEVCAFDAELWELVRDLEVAGGLAAQVPPEDPRHWTLLRAIDTALDAADPQDLAGTVPAARAALAGELAKPASASAHRLTAVGHAHIDSAWLWPVRETVRKVARTVSNVLDLMDTDPGFVYAMSSAQQFSWLEEHRPELFERVRARVAEGRFIPVGGMWVESDTTMPSGESMVRQFTYGKRYFQERFGIEPEEVWLPDCFGYSGALPQLARLAGFRWFLTQKISWNDTNTFPHHTFQWEGIDGSRIFTHFPPVDTYAAEVTAKELGHAVRNFKDKGVSSHSLVPFGHGDGGGGPTREMLARAARFADLEGAPTVDVRSPRAFFTEAEAELAGNGGAAVWVGELYLELHRGTFTSQLAMKQGNRRAEALLRTAEYLATAAALRTGAYAYPEAELADIWRTVLLHQFHDILPGSSISWVHREARATYRALTERLERLIGQACAALGTSGTADSGRLVPLPWSGRAAWAPVRAGEAAEAVRRERPEDGSHVLDNGLLRVVIDPRGHVSSLVDRDSGRELVPAGQVLGVLQLHRDEPVRWDAWDIDRDARRMRTDLTEPDAIDVPALEGGAAGVRVVRSTGASRIAMTISLAPGSRQLDMELDVDWHECERLLKVALPLAVHATSARYETQFGSVERTIHENTSWDAAHYEVCAHRYVHLAEPGFGAGVVNDSSYGCDVTRIGGPGGGSVVRLSLLRAPTFPDPETDQGAHRMRWAVVPSPDIAATVAAGYALNSPVVEGLPALAPLVELTATTGLPVIDTVKLADDGSGDVVVRLHEAAGGRATAVLHCSADLGDAPSVRETDLLERDLDATSGIRRVLLAPGPAGADGGVSARGARLALEPFQVVTLRLRRSV